MRVCPYCHLVRSESDATCQVCAPAEQAPEQALTPVPEALQARYGKTSPFAMGSTGSSYRATQTASNFRGLLKLIPLSGQEPSDRMRLKRELRKQTKLTNNSLVRIIDGGESGPLLWLFRDFVEGDSLYRVLKQRGPLDLPKALAIAAQVASALDELHRAGLLHRDVKPAHILLEPRSGAVPLVKLIDAGIATRMSTGAVFDMLGTPAYMSPEQIAGKLVSFRSDLYSLGCVLHEMLTGQPPFVAADVQAQLAAHKEQPPPELPEDVPAPVRSLHAALLQKEPRKRPFSAQQVRRTLEPFLPATTPPARSGTQTSAGNVGAPAGAAAAKAVPKAPGYNRNEPTEEIDLEEIALLEAEAEGGDFSQPRSTVQLSNEEVDALAAEAEAEDEDSPFSRARSTVKLTNDEVDALAAEVEAAGQAELDAEVELEADADLAESEDDDEEAQAGAPTAIYEPAGPAAAEAEPEEPAQGEQPAELTPRVSRPSVDFDVESLFDDEVREPAQRSSADAAAAASSDEGEATQLHRPQDAAKVDDQQKTAVYRPPGAVTDDSAARDSEGTVMVSRESEKKKPPMAIIAGGGVVLLLVLWLLFSGSEQAPESAEGPPAAAALPIVEAEKGPTQVGAAAGGQATGETAEADAPVEAQVVPDAGPGKPAAEAAQGQGEGEAEDEGTAEGTAQAEPAATAAVKQLEDAQRRAEREAGEEARRDLERSSDTGGKVRSAAGARDERVEKAAEHKAEGLAHYQAKRFREAAKAYAKATALTPSDAGAFAGLGGSHLAAGNSAEAIRAYQRAVRLKPDSANFHSALGRAYLVDGDRARAKAAYERALKLRPDHPAAVSALKGLK